MKDRSRVLLMMLIMFMACILCTCIAILILYHIELSSVKQLLAGTAGGQALLTEIRGVFIKAGLASVGISAVFVLLGLLFFRRLSNPLLSHLKTHSHSLERLVEDSNRMESLMDVAKFPAENPSPVMRATCDGEIVYANAASANVLESWHRSVGDTVPSYLLEAIKGSLANNKAVTIEDDIAEYVYSFVIAPVADFGYVNLYGRDITHHKQIEQELLESKALLQAALDQSPTGIAIADAPNGKMRYVNDVGLEIGGKKKEQLSDDIDIDQYVANWGIFQLDGSVYDDELPLTKALKYGQITSDQFIIRRKDGQDRVVIVNAAPIFDQQGKIIAGISVFLDVTDQRHAEKALGAMERRYQEIFEHSRDGFLMVDPAGNFTHANMAFCEMLDYTIDELRSKDTFYDITPRKWWDWEREEMWYNRLMGRGFTGIYEKEYIRKDGTVFPVELSSYVVKDQSGKLEYIWGIARDITARKRVIEELRNQREFERSLIDTAPVIILLLDTAGRIIRFNRYMQRLSGYSDEEVRGKDWFSTFLVDEDIDRIRKVFKDTVDDIDTSKNVNPIVTKEGKTLDIEWYSKTLKDAGGKTIGLFSIGQDITERIEAEQTRRDYVHFLECLSEVDKVIHRSIKPDQMLHDVINTVFDLFGCDRAWLLHPCDPEASYFEIPIECTCDGYPGGKSLGLKIPITESTKGDILEALHCDGPVACGPGNDMPISEDTANNFNVQSQMFMAIYPHSGSPWLFGMHQCEYSRVWSEAEKRLFKEIGRRISDSLSSLLFLKDLQESEAKMRSVFKAAPVGIAVERNRIFIDVNDRTCEMLGYCREELIGKDARLLYPSDKDYNLAGKELTTQIAEHGFASIETRWKQKGGKILDVLFNFAPVNADDPASAVTGVALDITDRKGAEKEIRRLNLELEDRVRRRTQQLEATNKELEAFSYSVSHDLRSPLRAINGFSQAVLEDYADKLDEVGQGYLNRVKNASERMGRLIDGLLRLSRLTRKPMASEIVDLSGIAQRMADDCTEAEPARNVTFNIKPGAEVQGDSDFLTIVIENLIGNSWKFTAQREEALIEFGFEDEDDWRIYYVRDNGVGFNMDYAGKLFGAFQRLHNQSEYPGTGIGLATVRRVINRHGGRIWAEGQVGKGATFYFTL